MLTLMYRYVNTKLSTMKKPTFHHSYQELFGLFSVLKSEQEAEKLLKDILTPQELASIAERWQLVKMLAQKVPQRDIKKALGISISKITRGSKELQFGHGGFKLMLTRLKIIK
ncbi:MAG TPA: YerC/YecD family TrpR-related protein [Patescibacteria group bacterium]|nr:YerC/YecD family TrpR-related protein [Patescibacteria group bacterium]